MRQSRGHVRGSGSCKFEDSMDCEQTMGIENYQYLHLTILLSKVK